MISNQRGWRHPAIFIAIGAIALLFIIGTSLIFFVFFAPHPFVGYFFPFGIFWVFLLVFLVFGILRWAFWGWGWRSRGYYGRYYDQAHQILRERYARGEITKEQLDQMMRDLDRRS